MEMQEEVNSLTKPQVILMDVYETLLNMNDVERRVNSLMDSKRGYTLWFELFMQYCFVDNCTVQFNDFTSIAMATMQMTSKTLGRGSIEESVITNLLESLKHLPVQDGVQRGLSQLKDQGFRIAALTNAPEKTVRERMERTGLISYFEMVLSAEKVKKYKPCIEVYEWAAKKLRVDAGQILMVSAHGWDIAGAANFGMQTVYIKQNKQMLYPLAPQPNFICTNMEDVALQVKTSYTEKK